MGLSAGGFYGRTARPHRGLLVVVLLVAACGGPRTVHMVHPTTREVRTCDAENWHPAEEGCFSWNCLHGLAARQWVKNCVSSARSLGFIRHE